MVQKAQSLSYRPEVDGLRAIAVLAVVLFHDGLGVPGGYIGVDVFFVISGFLITSLIVKELHKQEFTLRNFWERRVRRIIPAISVMVLVTLIAGWFLLLPADYASLARSAVWQAVFGVNIHYWLNTGYFADVADEMPLLHTWSLAVEEQFYLCVPLLLLVVRRASIVRGRDRVFAVLLGATIVSVVAAVYGVASHPAATFYLLPTRAWELLCGGLLSVAPRAEFAAKGRAWREVVATLGLASILLPCWLYSKATPFPGFAAVPPCFGAALFLWACNHDPGSDVRSLPFAARLLTARPFVFVGLISYSLYLWHWPLIVFASYWAPMPLTLRHRLTLAGAGLICGIVSWRYVETPFRNRDVCRSRTAMFAFTVGALTLIVALGVAILVGRGYPSRVPSDALKYANAREDKEGIYEMTARDIRQGRLAAIGIRTPKKRISLLLWGDSHAMAAAPAFDQYLRNVKLAGRQATASATAPILGAYWKNQFTDRHSVISFNDAVFDYIVQNRIPNVVLAGYWEYYTDDKGTMPFEQSLLTTIRRLVQCGTQPFLLLQVPHQPFSPPKALAMAAMFGVDLEPLLSRPSNWNGLRGTGNEVLNTIQVAGCKILNPRLSFIDSTGDHFIIERDGVSLYRDAHHLSAAGARAVLTPFLTTALPLDE